MIRLRVQMSTQLEFDFQHSGPLVRIGRNPDNELPLDHALFEAVSWQHAALEISPRGLLLTDLGSSNGTWLNYNRLNTRECVDAGCRFQLGMTGPWVEILGWDNSTPSVVEFRRTLGELPIAREIEESTAQAAKPDEAFPILNSDLTGEDEQQLKPEPNSRKSPAFVFGIFYLLPIVMFVCFAMYYWKTQKLASTVCMSGALFSLIAGVLHLCMQLRGR